MTFSYENLRDYLRGARLATVSTLGPEGAPQSALVGIGVTDDLKIVFDTVSDSRKHRNLLSDPRISVVVAGPDEQTLQYEGVATPISTTDPAQEAIRRAYYLSWPDGPSRLTWPNLAYWCITPSWARYSDFAKGPLVVSFFADTGS